MKRRLVLFALFFAACAVVAGTLSADELAFNLDFWYFNNTVGKSDAFVKAWAEAFHAEDFGRFSADERGILAFADDVLRGQVTRFVMNVNGQRSNVDSKAFEPVWRNGLREGMPEYEFVRVSKSFHNRGIDPYAIWTRRCREKGVEPWISVRMNDMHRADHEDCPSISDWWREHREFRRYPDSIPENVWFWESQSLDFAHVEVRDRILAYIEECLEKYDVAGLELDWTRFPWVFAPGQERENAPLLTDLLRKIRRTADAQAAKRGHHILISCRMLACPETEIALGRDVGAWAREGLIDIADVGNHWKTADYEIPVARWRKVLGNGAKVIPHVDCGLAFEGNDGSTGRRLLTREEYLGWVDVMRSRGCADFSLFNLFGHDSRSPEWNETLVRGFDPRETAASPRRYPLSYRDWGVTGADRDEYPQRLPCDLDEDFVFELPVGTVGVSDGAELILGFGNERGTLPSAKVNGTSLPAFASRPEPGCRGFSAEVPASVLKSGRNRVRVSACDGRRLVYAAIRVVPGVRPRSAVEGGGDKDVVIYVSCHPDDLAGSIGTVIRLRERYDVHVIEFTHGERGLGEAGYRDGSTRKTRTAEDEAVCRGIDVPLHWCEAVDGEAFADRTECERIAALYRQLKPRAIIVHSLVETHCDHMMSAAAAIKATQLAGIRPEIYFQEQEVQSRGFQPVYWVDVSTLTERRRELISLWASQDGPAIAERKIRTSEVNALRMARGQYTHAEVFGVFPGTVPPGKGIFDELPGVMR